MTSQASQPVSITLISDFNADTLARTLTAGAPHLSAQSAPFGRPHEALATVASAAQTDGDLVVWTQPQGAVAAFKDALTFKPYDEEKVLAEVDAFAGLIAAAAGQCRTVMVANWTTPAAARRMGPLDNSPNVGLRYLLMRMNLRLADSLAAMSNVYLLDTDRWISAAGGDAAWSPKLWAAAKVPFATRVFQAAAADIIATRAACAGHTRKILILDLDDTLWGGVVGEAGWQEVALGGHSIKGEAFLAFQQRVKALTNRGVILAIASKNDEAVALDAIRNHPDMALRLEDFAGWRINWQDKASNIADLLEELKLGVDAAVFIDDNPAERSLVSEALPGILVPDWPTDVTSAAATLDALDCFDTVSITEEDRARANLYAAERKRAQATSTLSTSHKDWLADLGVQVEATPLAPANLTRSAQLFNKTNQMNMATRRMTAEELSAWADHPGHTILTFRVSDKFGDYGLTGIVGLQLDGTSARITDFLLSC
ncbi:MAG: HAD-IIIC family phosphatase, partial [Pseudomonadota bacterium]